MLQQSHLNYLVLVPTMPDESIKKREPIERAGPEFMQLTDLKDPQKRTLSRGATSSLRKR